MHAICVAVRSMRFETLQLNNHFYGSNLSGVPAMTSLYLLCDLLTCEWLKRYFVLFQHLELHSFFDCTLESGIHFRIR